MTTPADSTGDALEAAAVSCGGRLHRSEGGQWRVALANGRPFEVLAAVDPVGEWLQLDAPASGGQDARHAWNALVVNGRLAGVAKLALAPGGLRLRAEIPLDRRDVLAARVARACRGFKDALSLLGGGPDVVARTDTGPGVPAADGLAAACREAGWSVSERANGRVAVNLECGRRFHQALLRPRGAGGVLVAAELVRAAALPSAARGALAALLLAATARLRLVRAAAEEEDGQVWARLEVAFETTPEASDLNHALSALAAGCSLAGDEARVLQHERLAARYLALRNLSVKSRRSDAGFAKEQP